METREIVEMALKLKASERFEIIEKLRESLDKSDPEIDRIWGEEASRRLRAHDDGRLTTVSLEEALGDS